jgi:hypothetical protein
VGIFAWHTLFSVLALCAAAYASGLAELQKPPPDVRRQPSRKHLEALVRERYPELFTRDVTGSPVVTVLFNPDGTVARSSLQLLAVSSGTLTATETRFEGLGLHSGELQDVGEFSVQLPHTTAFVVFGTRSDEALDRDLVERYFPQAVSSGIPGGEKLWILFDHAGQVRKYGAVRVQSADLRKTMEHLYPGIHIAQATVAPVMGRNGRPLEDLGHEALRLNCLWLAADSPLPAR